MSSCGRESHHHHHRTGPVFFPPPHVLLSYETNMHGRQASNHIIRLFYLRTEPAYKWGKGCRCPQKNSEHAISIIIIIIIQSAISIYPKLRWGTFMRKLLLRVEKFKQRSFGYLLDGFWWPYENGSGERPHHHQLSSLFPIPQRHSKN